MKLLVIARNYKQFVSRQVTYHLITELNRITDLYIWHDRGNSINTILQTMNIEPDFILILEYFETNATKVTDLHRLTIPYAVSVQDLHWDIQMRKELFLKEKIDHIFTASRDGFLEKYPEFEKQMHWLPHNANTNIFKDYSLPKDIDYLLMGLASSRYYPLRVKILNAMKDKPGFVYHSHPGYREYSDDEDIYVREKYAREINRAKIFFTCGGIYHYPVAKYFEVLACNTLLLAPSSPELEDLGLIPGVHFVAIDENDFEEKAEYYLHHENERLQIAQQGYEMVHSRHSSSRRAADLLAVIKDIIESHNGTN